MKVVRIHVFKEEGQEPREAYCFCPELESPKEYAAILMSLVCGKQASVEVLEVHDR